MKFTKRVNSDSTIRKVWSNDKEVCFGIVGTVKDLLKEGILVYCDYDLETWAFVPFPGILHKTWFGDTREKALENLPAGI